MPVNTKKLTGVAASVSPDFIGAVSFPASCLPSSRIPLSIISLFLRNTAAFNYRMLKRMGTLNDNSLAGTRSGGRGTGWARVSMPSTS